MKQKNWTFHLLLAFSSCVLFSIYFVRLALQAQGKPFWADEVDGIYGALHFGWAQLLYTGAPQMSRSPLVYLIDRGMLALWGDHPHASWDLRIYLRLAPAFFWSLASTSILSFTWLFLRKKFSDSPKALIFLVSVGASVFFYENSFMNIYAIETRAYSLWVSLSTLQFCLWWNVIDRKAKALDWALLLFVSFLMTFTTTAAIGQIAILLAVDFWTRMRNPSLRNGKSDFYWWGAIALTCLSLAFWYQRNAGNYGYPTSPLSLYFESVLEVMLKCFHHHGVQPAFLTFPLFLLVIPIARWRNPSVQAGALFTWLMLLLSFAFFLASLMKGGIYASRYAIFLIPSLTWIYFLGVSTLLALLLNKLADLQLFGFARHHLKSGFVPLLAIIAFFELSGGIKKFMVEINQGIHNAKARNAFGPAADPELCSKPLVFLPQYSFYETPEQLVREFEALNKKCRGL